MANLIRHPSDEGLMYAARDTPPCSKALGRWVLTATILGSSMAIIDGTAVNVALPVLQKSLNATVSEIQWVVEAYALFLAALLLVGGSLGDLWGRKRVFAIGIALFAAASIGCGLALNITQLILARAIQGVGGALLLPGSLALISTTFSKEQRGRAIGTWSGFSVITGALGPVLGGWLVENVSWRGIFFLNVAPAVIALGVLFLHVPESRDETSTGKLDWWGALLAVTGLGLCVYGLISSTDLGMGHPLVLSTLLLGGGALLAFLLWEARSHTPMVPLGLFQSRIFSGANVSTFLLYSAFGCVLFFFPFNLIQIQGYSPAAAGGALLPLILIVFLFSRWSGGLVNRYGARLPLIAGPLIVACGLALYTLPAIGGSYWLTFFPAVAVQGLGVAITIAPLTTTVMGAVESEHAGLASGINNAVARTAALLSVAVLSILFLSAFSNTLQNYLATAHIAEPVRQELIGQLNKLADISVPAGVSDQGHALLEQSIHGAFVSAFRAVMFVATGLALISSLVAFLTIQKRPLATSSNNQEMSGGIQGEKL